LNIFYSRLFYIYGLAGINELSGHWHQNVYVLAIIYFTKRRMNE